MLWTASAYLLRHNKMHWITTVPALFMTTVCASFILSNSTLGFGLPINVSTVAGILFALAVAAYVIKTSKGKGETDLADEEKPEVTTKTA
jgi:carbon starvation protein CstA